MCLSFRQWIVPEPAVVRDDGASLTILDAPLDVKLESEYIEAVGGTGRSYCPTSQRAAEEHNEAVFRQMILPRVRTAVNRAPEYADLRRVYTSRVAAEWYRNRSIAEDTAYGDLVDSEDISGWVLTGQWSPRKVFDSYVDSYANGEFNVTRRSTAGSMIYEHTYVFGGVDFSSVPFREVSVDYMQREQAGLPETIERSITRAAADGSDQRWLGAVTNAAPPAGGFQPRDVTRLVRSDGFRIARWPLAVGVLVVLAVVLRRRGIRI